MYLEFVTSDCSHMTQGSVSLGNTANLAFFMFCWPCILVQLWVNNQLEHNYVI